MNSVIVACAVGLAGIAGVVGLTRTTMATPSAGPAPAMVSHAVRVRPPAVTTPAPAARDQEGRTEPRGADDAAGREQDD